MISMLIYCCKQDEIELLKEISRDIVAYCYNERMEITVVNAKENMEFQEMSNIDIAFIDITEKSGLQMAKDLREHFSKAEIMLISDNKISPVLYLIPEIRAASLLLKPLQYNEVESGVRGLFSLLEQNMADDGSFFLFEDDKEQKRIPYCQILYFEARNRKIYARLRGKEYGMHGTLETLEEHLPDNFRRCHRGFIVNVTYINEVWYSKNFIMLKNEIEIPLSRRYKSIIKEVVSSGGSY